MSTDVKSTCGFCTNNITHPAELSGTVIDCPHCGKETVLDGNGRPAAPAPVPAPAAAPKKISPPAATPKKAAAPAATLADGSEAPQAFLKRVQGNTCYRTLRRIIYFVTSLMFASAILVLLAGVGGVVLGPGDLATKIGAFVLSLCLAAVQALMGFAFREIAGLLLDIADVLIEQNRRK